MINNNDIKIYLIFTNFLINDYGKLQLFFFYHNLIALIIHNTKVGRHF